MMNPGWTFRLLSEKHSLVAARCMTAAILGLMAGTAVAQLPMTVSHATAPDGYTLHESIDLGGHVANLNGSNAMYDTLVNQQSGPRILGETFELRALPDTKNTLVDHLKAFTSGLGGDPNNVAKLEFSKGKLYDFSGLFRRDRQYFDYNLLGNPNLPPGQSIPIGPAAAPTGSYAWPQVTQSPFMFNTVRRMTDTKLTLLPLSKVTFRVGYSQNIFQGPSLTPSGYQVAGSYDLLLQEYQRNSTDDWTGSVEWKPVPRTRLTFEEQVTHYKGDSYLSMAPQYFKPMAPGSHCSRTTTIRSTSRSALPATQALEPPQFTRRRLRTVYPSSIRRVMCLPAIRVPSQPASSSRPKSSGYKAPASGMSR
jgi:hypothetical protein